MPFSFIVATQNAFLKPTKDHLCRIVYSHMPPPSLIKAQTKTPWSWDVVFLCSCAMMMSCVVSLSDLYQSCHGVSKLVEIMHSLNLCPALPPRKKVSWMATVCCNLKHFCILFAKNWIVEISKTIYKCWLIFCSWVEGWGCNGNSGGITPPAEGPKQLYLPTHPNAITPSGPVPVASHHQHRLIKKQS